LSVGRVVASVGMGSHPEGKVAARFDLGRREV
jgi:hypothetical protein